MNCCNCCVKSLFLGCYSPCDMVLDFNDVVDLLDAGQWTLFLSFGRQYQQYTETFNVGDQIIFDLSNMNEFFTYDGYVLKPDGTKYTIDINGESYDCFEFMTKIGAISGIII